MTDFVITHRIEAPELAAALNNLADALKNRPVAAPVVENNAQPIEATVDTPAPATPVQAVSEAPVNPTVAPVTPIANGPTPATTNAPIAAAPTPVPVEAPAPVSAETSNPAPAPKVITFEDIALAGGQLLELDAKEQSNTRMTQLMDLLKSFGVQAITQLKPEQYADVAAGLRELGAKI